MHALQRAESAARKSEADAGDDVPQQSSSEEEVSDYVDTGDDQGDDELSEEDNSDNRHLDEDVDDAAKVDDAAHNKDVDDAEKVDYAAENEDVHPVDVPASASEIPSALISHDTDPCKWKRNSFSNPIT